MKKIIVYADFDFLTSPEEIGALGYEHVRGKDHFVFEYSRQWLKQHGGILLSGDLLNVPSLQHPRSNDNVFGFVKDSFPDRWGRLLFDRRERLTAQQEGRPKRMLTNYDYLLGIEDFTRMGGIRYKEEEGDDYINASAKYLVPPIESLRALCDACHEIELAEERNELPEQRWLDQLIDPGTSLGGARPKANVVDTDGTLYVAKFPSKKDLENTELIEHFSHQLAAKAGINVVKTRTIKISKDRDLLLSERFDRTAEGRRIHFASAETAILTSLISSFVGVPMCARISANSIAEWHITSCLATPMTTSEITVSCLPRKAGHYRLHTTSILERSHINACLSTHTQKSQTSTRYSLQVKATCLNTKKHQKLSRRFVLQSKTGAKPLQKYKYPQSC